MISQTKTGHAIAIMQAWQNGGRVEYRTLTSDWRPVDFNHNGWNFEDHEYRINSNPREFWVCPRQRTNYGDGEGNDYNCVDHKPHNPLYIHVREVLEDA